MSRPPQTLCKLSVAPNHALKKRIFGVVSYPCLGGHASGIRKCLFPERNAASKSCLRPKKKRTKADTPARPASAAPGRPNGGDAMTEPPTPCHVEPRPFPFRARGAARARNGNGCLQLVEPEVEAAVVVHRLPQVVAPVRLLERRVRHVGGVAAVAAGGVA